MQKPLPNGRGGNVVILTVFYTSLPRGLCKIAKVVDLAWIRDMILTVAGQRRTLKLHHRLRHGRFLPHPPIRGLRVSWLFKYSICGILLALQTLDQRTFVTVVFFTIAPKTTKIFVVNFLAIACISAIILLL